MTDATNTAMTMTLYEPAFNVLTKRYPTRFRDGITRLTLVGGFASTLSYPAVAALMAAFARVLDHGMLLLGPEVEAFEQRFAAACRWETC